MGSLHGLRWLLLLTMFWASGAASAAAVQQSAAPKKSAASLFKVPDRRVVPDLYGLPVGEAWGKLNDLGLRSSVVPDAATEFSCVASQNPPAGTSVAVGATVDIQTASDCPKATVPDLDGMTRDQAQQRLAQAGLALGATRDVDSDRGAGLVVSQNPGPGVTAKPNAQVAIDLSRGPSAAPPPQPVSTDIKVPNLVGRPIDQARAIVRKSGLTISSEQGETSVKPTGTVIRQEPLAGTVVKKGSSVSVAIAAPLLVVPNVIGLTQDAAESALTQAGFSLGNVSQQRSHAPPGQIIEQEPRAGSQFIHAAPVAIVIAAVSTVEVPSLQGLHLRDAVSRLRKRGLHLGQVAPGQFDTALAVVKEQSPSAHQWVDLGTLVDLTMVSRRILARVWVIDSTMVPGDSATVGVDISPAGAATAFRFDFGDGHYSPWTNVPRAKHAYQSLGTYRVRASVQLSAGGVILAEPTRIRVTRNLTLALTVVVLGFAAFWPLIWKAVLKLPVPALHVQLVPRLGRPATVGAASGDHAVWSLAIVSPGPFDSCDIHPTGPLVTERRAT